MVVRCRGKLNGDMDMGLGDLACQNYHFSSDTGIDFVAISIFLP
jgi:hypothetical protein